MTSSSIRIVPLGGLGEIGMNCLAVEQGRDVLVVDCGVSFPEQDLGLDVVHPDFTYLIERASDVRGIFITHGHEDHIGALPFLLDEINVPVWGPPHALELSRRRLGEHGVSPNDVRLSEVRAGHTCSIGPFEVEPVRVAHSIVEATALRIGTAAGTVLHTGDFNFDPDPPDGEPTDEARLRAIGDAGVGLLLSDSTNVDVPEPGRGERHVGSTLDRIVQSAPERVFITMFASNVQRLILLGETALRTGRKVCLLGRSLRTQFEVATQIQRLHWPSDLVIPPELAKTLPRSSVLVLAGGTQGESRSAMARLAEGTHPAMNIDPGDTVVLSSRAIPGNERGVFRMIGNLLRLGAEVIHRVTEPGVHTSGHATRAEQRRMIDLLRPKCFVPVHGTLHHLTRHAALAREAGVANIEVVENGTPVVFDGNRVFRGEGVHVGKVSIAPGGEPVSDETLRQRVELARFGLVTLVAALDGRGRLLGQPRLSCRGVVGADAYPGELRRIEKDVEHHIRRIGREMSEPALKEELRLFVRREFFRLGGVRPVVDVHIAGGAG